MSVQIPKSIYRIAPEVITTVHRSYPNISHIDDVPTEFSSKWESICDHELFYQDVNRFIDDIYTELTYKKKL